MKPTFEEFVNCDMNVMIAEQLTVDGILELVLKEEEDILKSEDENQENNEFTVSISIVPKLCESSEATKTLRTFFEAGNNLPKYIEDRISKRI